MAHQVQEGWQLKGSQGRQQRAGSFPDVAQVRRRTALAFRMLCNSGPCNHRQQASLLGIEHAQSAAFLQASES